MAPPYRINDWQQAAAEKRQALQSSIPASHRLPPHLQAKANKDELVPSSREILESGLLSPLEIEITDIDDAAVLVDRIATRTYTAVQVTEAFCKRASIAQQTTNCLTEIMYSQALARSQSLDEYQAKEGKTMGILHGLPVSLKDTFDISGVPTTSGLVSWLPNVAKEDSSVTKSLLAAGAVLYVKTNISQAFLMVESINNVFGTSKNPYNLALSVGGSSGGEAGLVAARGSILGSGTDGGGSIRFPAAFCGLWGVKPSKGRIPADGVSGPSDGNESVNMGIGPMARSVSSLELWLKAQLQNRPWDFDQSAIFMPWKQEQAFRTTAKLRIGVLWDDGVVKPTPPITRSLSLLTSRLRKAGHEIVNLPGEKMKDLHRRGLACTMKSNVQAGGHSIMKHIDTSGEPVVPRTAIGSSASLLTSAEVFENHLVRSEISSQYNRIWIDLKLDAILAPAVAHPACPHGKYVSNSYATIYNMLDYSTGSVPVTKVDLEVDVAPKEWYEGEVYPRIEEHRFPYDWGDKEMKRLYEGPHVYKDAPVGLQIVCRRLREEKLVGIMKEVEALLEGI